LRTANNLYVTVYKLRQLLYNIDFQGDYLRWHDDHALEISPGVCDYIDFINFGSENAVINSKNVTAAAAADPAILPKIERI
jgi:hypothetical protein